MSSSHASANDPAGSLVDENGQPVDLDAARDHPLVLFFIREFT